MKQGRRTRFEELGQFLLIARDSAHQLQTPSFAAHPALTVVRSFSVMFSLFDSSANT